MKSKIEIEHTIYTDIEIVVDGEPIDNDRRVRDLGYAEYAGVTFTFGGEQFAVGYQQLYRILKKSDAAKVVDGKVIRGGHVGAGINTIQERSSEK